MFIINQSQEFLARIRRGNICLSSEMDEEVARLRAALAEAEARAEREGRISHPHPHHTNFLPSMMSIASC